MRVRELFYFEFHNKKEQILSLGDEAGDCFFSLFGEIRMTQGGVL